MNNLKGYSKLLGVEQKDIAKKMGITPAQVTNIVKSYRASVRIDIAQSYVNTLIDLSSELSNGTQCLLIDIKDVFY